MSAVVLDEGFSDQGWGQNSPLSLHLTKGVIITRLDDNSLALPHASDTFWMEYLTGTGGKGSMGWCLPKTFLGSQLCYTYFVRKSSNFHVRKVGFMLLVSHINIIALGLFCFNGWL